MAFWATASAVSCQARRVESTAVPAAAKPITIVLHASGDFHTLVRLRIKVPSTASVIRLGEGDDGHTDETAHAAGVAVGRLHQLISQLELKSAETCRCSVIQIQSLDLLQVLCQKAVVAKIYKSLMPHQAALGFQLGDVKSCISLIPLGLWELHEALQAAVFKALTGNSSSVGTGSVQADSSSNSSQWTSLTSNKVVRCDVLSAAPGVLQTAFFVDFEVKAQPPSKALLLVRAAGRIKFRLFCPMQTLLADAKTLKAPLQASDTTDSLLADPAKLAAAARQLDGRAVKLLPDERMAFIKSLRPARSDPRALEDFHHFYLGHYGLRLPSNGYPFLVGVASHPEAESASLEVPSCCVMTNLGLSVLPSSSPGGSSYHEVVKALLNSLRSSELQLFGAGGFTVETVAGDNSGATAVADAQLQVSQIGSQAASKAASEITHGSSSTMQPKTYSIAAKWTTALDVSKLEAAAKAEAAAAVAGSQHQQHQSKGAVKLLAGPARITAAAAQLMGIDECDVQTAAADAISDCAQLEQPLMASAAADKQKPRLQGHSRPNTSDPSRWSGLNEFLAERAKQQDKANSVVKAAAGGLGVPQSAHNHRTIANSSKIAATVGVNSKLGMTGAMNRNIALLGAAVTEHQSADLDVSFATRADSIGITVKAAAAAAKTTAETAAHVQALAQAPVLKKTPTLGTKRPAPAPAAAAAARTAKPPAGKKAKTAAAAGADGNSAASKPKTARKAAAAAGATAAGSVTANAEDQSNGHGTHNAGLSTAGTADSGVGVAAAGHVPAAAAPTAPKRAKTKASDLDVNAVTAKVQAAYAAGGGGSLKGLNVAEMQCYLRANGQKGGPTKKAEIEARLLGYLNSKNGSVKLPE